MDWPGCQRIFNLYIGINNIRGLSSDDQLLDLEAELSWINWTIIGLSDVWLKSKGCIELNNTGYTGYYSGSSECQHGVDFVVNTSIAGNVVIFKGKSDRVAKLNIRINQWYQLMASKSTCPLTATPMRRQSRYTKTLTTFSLTAELTTIRSWETSTPKSDLDTAWKSALTNMAWEKGTSEATC